MLCTECGHENPPLSSFCNRCGAPQEPRELGAPDAQRQGPQLVGGVSARGERRQLTVMFCDLVGSTRLAERVDLEELRDVLLGYQAACSRAIAQFDGHVAQFLGDGILAYFGYPIAHEDDAERAVRAALEIQHQLVRGFATDAARARIGIHTGMVVIGPVGSEARQERLAVGSTTNIAARIQGIAEEGGIVISEATYRLTSGVFARDIGARQIRGLDEPLHVYLVHRAYEGSRRSGAPETPLFGRDDEVRRLRAWASAARQGRGRVVWLSGEPGIGKSRLLHALREDAAIEPRSWLDISCSPFSSGSALRPVIDLLQERLALHDEPDPRRRTQRLTEALSRLPNLAAERVAPFLAALLGLPADDAFPLPVMTPEQQRERTMEALRDTIEALAGRQLLVVAIEDVQWADPSTLQFLDHIVELASRTRMLLVCTARSEFALPWRSQHVEQLLLSRLPPGPSHAMVESIAGGRRLSVDLVHEIADRSDGVPLFLEQLTHEISESAAVAETGELRIDRTKAIPATLRGLLMARLDRLGAAKRVAQLAASIGREFSEDLLRELDEFPKGGLQDGLARLVRVGLILPVSTPPHAGYRFRHALFQESAYQSLMRSDRRAVHERVASVLETRFPAVVAADPAAFARHCDAASLYDKAATHYQLAGVLAAGRFANREAVSNLRLALDALLRVPDSEQRRAHELACCLALAQPLIASLDLDHPDVRAIHERIASLCDVSAAALPQLPGLLYLSRYFMRRGEIDKSAAVGENVLRIARGAHVPLFEAIANLILGTCEITRSPAPIAIGHLTRALELASTIQLPSAPSSLEPDLLAFIHATLGLALAVGGRFDEAAEHAEAARARAIALNHQPSCILVISLSTVTFCLMSAFERARAWSRQALELGAGRGFRSAEAQAHVMSGWARVALGDPAGLEEAEAGLSQAIAMGFRGGLCHHIQAAAEANRLAGRYERAHQLLDLAQQTLESTSERIFAGRVCRSRGMVFLLQDAAGKAEAELHQAVELLGEHGARVEQLMAASELLRLALGRPDEAAARARAAELLREITGGDAFPALREARELIGARTA